MKQKRIILFTLLLSTVVFNVARAQVEKQAVLNAESLTSGNYKDLFKSFFQLAFNQLTTDKKEFAFSTNPYAIMVKLDSSKLLTPAYLKYTALRRLNISFAGKLNAENRFNGFSSGLKYAVINQRDETTSMIFLRRILAAGAERSAINNALSAYIQSLPLAQSIQVNQEVLDLFNGVKNFNQLSTGLQAQIRTLANNGSFLQLKALLENGNQFNFRDVAIADFNDLKDNFQKRWLVTLGISDTTYSERFQFSTVVVSAEILKGISEAGRAVGAEVNINAGYNFVNDTLKAGRDLQRRVLHIEPGFNFIFNDRNTISWAEFKVSGEYNRIFSGIYSDERKTVLTLNGTLRVRLLKDLWIPIEIKYDPKEGRVFGFLDVRFNFTALGR